jgi:hypothetical protein
MAGYRRSPYTFEYRLMSRMQAEMILPTTERLHQPGGPKRSRSHGFFQTCAYQSFAGVLANDRIVAADFAKREIPFRG